MTPSAVRSRFLRTLLVLLVGGGMLATTPGCREKEQTLGDKVEEAAEEAQDEADDAM